MDQCSALSSLQEKPRNLSLRQRAERVPDVPYEIGLE